MYKEQFGEKLRQARLEAGYTQEQISKILEISQPSLAHYEANRREPDIETLGKLIDFYEVSADWILGTGIKKVTQ